MLGLSYGEIFILLGATAALIGPKDLPIIARTAGRLVGKAIGNVQKFRGELDSVMQHSQAAQVNKDVQELMEQMAAIRRQMQRTGIISSMNPTTLSRRLIDNPDLRAPTNNNAEPQKLGEEHRTAENVSKEFSLTTSVAANLQSQAAAFERLAKFPSLISGIDVVKSLNGANVITVLPISAEDTKFLSNRTEFDSSLGSLESSGVSGVGVESFIASLKDSVEGSGIDEGFEICIVNEILKYLIHTVSRIRQIQFLPSLISHSEEDLLHMIGASTRLPPVQRLVKIKIIAEQLHFKVSILLLHHGKIVEDMTWYRKHIACFKRLVGAPEVVFLHWEWMSRQFLVFAELLETSSATGSSTVSLTSSIWDRGSLFVMDDLPLWKFEDRVEGFPAKDSALAFLGQKVIQVDEPEPQVDLVNWPCSSRKEFHYPRFSDLQGSRYSFWRVENKFIGRERGWPDGRDEAQNDPDNISKVQEAFGLVSVPYVDIGKSWSCKLEIKWHRPKPAMLFVSLGQEGIKPTKYARSGELSDDGDTSKKRYSFDPEFTPESQNTIDEGDDVQAELIGDGAVDDGFTKVVMRNAGKDYSDQTLSRPTKKTVAPQKISAMSHSLLVWNARGLGNKKTVSYLKHLLKLNDASLLPILKPFIDVVQLSSIAMKLGFAYFDS
ncbi:hypothetical protein GIB67_036407 [Kingdonia uniflora]|uniref:Trafficking protein particle complex subunit 11 domain-containing protein n=1 Tax=Kingdonia uniflora TaxID=39325 RepID=A0A7J7L422_9MAGN|nr:hypothetical protein GIB67_036407 [Kingdonia uniflora]